MLNQAQDLLKQYYGYEKFRTGQTNIIESILNRADTLAIMPTGAGKSICFQIPALLFSGMTMVISPLISLMKDQVDDLVNIGINAASINSFLSQPEADEIIFRARQGKYKMLYVAPERLESEKFRILLSDLEISFVAVDEAHCVSSWGHDFRPSYKEIAPFINSLPQRPVVGAFTATATKSVREDIVRLLMLDNPNIYISGFNRENLFFDVLRGENKLEYIKRYARSHVNDAGIVYAATRKEVDNICDALQQAGFSAGRYHAGMGDDDRRQTQDAFTYDNIKIMVATNAFGMGIDKSNVRYVIHHNLPKNMEAYYQEAGRAGRDGDAGECIILYAAQDVKLQKYLIEQSTAPPERKSYDYQRLQHMVGYAYTDMCHRKYILNYFEERFAPDYCGNCGNCQDGAETVDITLEAKKVFSCVLRMRERYGMSLVAEVLKGSKSKKVLSAQFDRLTTYALLKDKPMDEIKNLIHFLISQYYLAVSEDGYSTVSITPKAADVLRDKAIITQKLSAKKPAVSVKTAGAKADDIDEPPKSDHFNSLFEKLRKLRRELAFKQGVPPYIIFSDSTLKDMCQKIPTNLHSFGLIKGVGETKTERYGEIFIKAIREEVGDDEFW